MRWHDLAGLAIFGGALGLGFGLQRIAANRQWLHPIADRSIRQGDVIAIGERFGIVRELRALCPCATAMAMDTFE